LIIVLVVAVGMVGLASTATASTTKSSGHMNILKLTKQYLKVWNTHSVAKVTTWFAPNAKYYEPTSGLVTGRDQIRTKILDDFFTACPDFDWEIDTTHWTPIVKGRSIAFEWTFAGHNTGNWADGTPATNKAFDFVGTALFRFNSNGKIIYQDDCYDALTFYKQLGIY
jgi:steroid delta-isomerase-like uncharacterized protein